MSFGLCLILATAIHWQSTTGKKPVLQSQESLTNVEVACRFQLAERGSFAFAATNNLRVSIHASRGDQVSVKVPGGAVVYRLKAYETILPTWPEAMRLPLERDMALLPGLTNHWFHLHCELATNRFRVWLDDRFIGETNGVDATGPVSLGLDATNIVVTPLAPTSEFLPLSLEGYALDEGGTGPVTSDIPFRVMPARHIDVGRSLFRQANLEGYESTLTPQLGSALVVDPARIQLRIPNDAYDALYVLASFDGQPNHISTLTASFYKPGAGFHQIFTGEVTSRKPTVVRIPLDPARLASFEGLPALELELSKAMQLYRSYPDPILYGWRPGGLPSGVKIHALTLHRAPVKLTVEPMVFGHVWTSPAVPSYRIRVSRADAPVTVAWDGQQQTFTGTDRIVELPVTKNGFHTVTVSIPGWTETRHFVRLAPDTRAPVWEEGHGALFGYWSYHGGHDTPPATDIMAVMRAAGARGTSHIPKDKASRTLAEQWQWREGGNARVIGSPMRAWGSAAPDTNAMAAFQANALASIRNWQGDAPEIVALFAEPHISRDLTTGSPPDYWGEPAYQLNADEQRSLTAFQRTAVAAATIVRQTWPKTKVLIPWGDPLFVIPLLRAGFPRELIDGSGLDMIGFERLPEQQIHQMSTHRLFFLREEYRKYGMPDPLLAYVEGIFVPTEPGACTWQEQADRYHRWTLLSLAYGVERFYSGWFAYDCGNWYGAEHYGGCGIQRRLPYADPKPAYAHFATMTRQLDGAKFECWLPTGSLSVYCLRFSNGVHAMWTLRGKRPVSFPKSVTITDSMDNNTTTNAFTLGTSPVYIRGDLTGLTLGEPDHSDAAPAGKVIANLGNWRFTDERDLVYEKNNYDTTRYPAKMTGTPTNNALAVHLETPAVERKFMPHYAVLRPPQPITIAGKADALGLWVEAHSDWGRVVYSLIDAKGERWLSCGTKDAWTADDPHSWSSFCFDGRRYLRFPLPANSPWDDFREAGSTWWGSYGGDHIVDLPVKLDAIIVERRTHVMYVNDPQPADRGDIRLGDLVAEYSSETPPPQIRMPLPTGPTELPNPIVELSKGELPPVALENVTMPDWGYDGTRCHVHFTEMPDAAKYTVWVSAYPDGRGAVALGTMKKSGGLLNNLRPAMKLYLWVTYSETAGKKGTRQSRPSNRLEIELIDAFGMK